MKKIKMIVMFFGIFLLLGAVNVKAYDVTSLTGNYNVTINKFVLNLYETPEENATSAVLFGSPISFNLPLGESAFSIDGDVLKSKELRVDENTVIPISLVELDDNFDATNVGAFLDSQTFDKTKTYYGDIEVEYTVNTFPSTFKTFNQFNSFRYLVEHFEEIFTDTFGGEGTVTSSGTYTMGKPGVVSTTLTSGNSFTTTQMLNLFSYDGTAGEDGDKFAYYDKMENDEDYALGIFGYNFGVFSEKESFDIKNIGGTDSAIMFSIIDGMDRYIDYANLANLGDDYVGDVFDDDEFGTEIVKVGNTAASKNTILILIGLILLISGSALVGNIINRKRYN